MIFILCVMLRPALLGYEQPKKYWFYTPITLLAWVVDVVVCHTTWRLISGPLEPGEWTVSQTLPRLSAAPGVRQQLFTEIAKEINRQSPSGRHINVPD